jgi:hypothetical protein
LKEFYEGSIFSYFNIFWLVSVLILADTISTGDGVIVLTNTLDLQPLPAKYQIQKHLTSAIWVLYIFFNG